jgi:hypothetical protein
MKKVLKFKYQETEGFLSVVDQGNFHFALVKKDTPKVTSIRLTHELLISYELKIPKYQAAHTHVIEDPKVIEWVYRSLEADNNLYFKELDDSLCVLEIRKL